ncbi:MAG: amino acid adenylation protein, partial [Mucilaginibacter sp.]|nr:amino acid adenylation protein [Mucilaginibacter sp.]
MGNIINKASVENSGFLIHQLFEQQKNRTPEATAVIFGDEKLTYSQLDKKATALANAIYASSPASSIAAVSTIRSIETIVSVLAVLKAGKAYLPLDAEYPADRLQQIITDSEIDLCLTATAEKALFESLSIKVLVADKEHKPGDEAIATSISACYVLYTSGSTGTPKGVSMGHAALANLLSWQQKNSISAAGVNTLQFAPLSFDVSFQEIFSTLTTGGTLVLVNDDLRIDPYRLLRYISQNSVNRIFLPFVVLQYLTEAAAAENYFPACLNEVFTAGELLKITPQIVSFFSELPECVLFKQYGPTDTH